MHARIGRAATGMLLVAALACGSGDRGLPAPPPLPAGLEVTAATSPLPALRLVVDTVARGLAVPWGIAPLPDGRLLVTERAGRIRLVEGDSLRARPWATVPVYADDPRHKPESGLMGIAVAPDWATSRAAYVLATVRSPIADTSRTFRARAWRRLRPLLGGVELERETGLVDHVYRVDEVATPAGDRAGVVTLVPLADVPTSWYHAGGALASGPDSALYAAFGDAMRPELAGGTEPRLASVQRLAGPARQPGPFATGLRNVQGLAFHPATRELFAIDHGPSGMPQEGGRAGHDELNVLREGAWYGWGAPPVLDGHPLPHVPPVAVWTEAIAPAGLAFAPPSWGADQLLVTGLRSGALHRLQLARDADGRWRVTAEERLLAGHGRLRALAVDASGAVWVGTSNHDGRGAPKPGDDLLLRVRVR